MIASLSAGICCTPAGCPSPALPDLWLPPRARDATRLPPLRSGKAAIPPLQRFQRPTTPAAVAAVRAARRAAGLQKLWAPLRARATFADVQRARDAEKRKKDLAFQRRRRRRKPPAPTTPPRPATPPPRTPPATPPPKKPRKALPPLPPPKPAAVDASLGTYAVDATLVDVPRRDVTIDGASLEFCARAGDADAVAELGRAMGTRLWPASNVLVQYLDTLSLEGERVLELGAGAGLCGLYAQRARRCERIVLTDHDVTTLKLLRHNAALNASCGHVHALDWHSPGDLAAVLELHGTFSTILASDVLFQARDLGAFYACAAKLLSPNGRLVVAYEDRVAGLEAKVLAEAKRAGFSSKSIPLESFFDPDRDVVDGGRDEARLFGEAVVPGNGSWDSLRLWEMSMLRRSGRRRGS